MRHVLKCPRPNYLPLSFELEDVDSPEEFVWRVTRELLKHDALQSVLSKAKRLPKAFTAWVKNNFDEAEFEGAKIKFKADIKEDWREAAKRMLIELEKADKTIIFLFDEFPAMLDRLIERQGEPVARDFLAWFRTVRMEQKDVLRRHRFIVAGSVGIDQILRKLGAADKLVDFYRLTVEPLDNTTAHKLAGDLARSLSVNCNDAILGRLFELIGAPVPYFIHIFMSQIAQLPLTQRTDFTIADLERIYKNRILGPLAATISITTAAGCGDTARPGRKRRWRFFGRWPAMSAFPGPLCSTSTARHEARQPAIKRLMNSWQTSNTTGICAWIRTPTNSTFGSRSCRIGGGAGIQRRARRQKLHRSRNHESCRPQIHASRNVGSRVGGNFRGSGAHG